VHPRLKTNYQTLLTRCVEESVKEMKRILVLLVLLVVGTRSYADIGIIYSEPVQRIIDGSRTDLVWQSEPNAHGSFGVFGIGKGKYKFSTGINEDVIFETNHINFGVVMGGVVGVIGDLTYFSNEPITLYNTVSRFSAFTFQYVLNGIVLQYSFREWIYVEDASSPFSSLEYDPRRSINLSSFGIGYYF